jgi:hypothetical protein
MRLYEVQFSNDELEQIREEIRKEHPHLTEEQIDEILPAIAMGAARLGSMAVKGVGALARGVGTVAKGIGKGIGSVARTAGGMAKQAGSSAVKFGKDQINKQAQKTVSNNLSTGGRTNSSDANNNQDPTAAIQQLAQANNELQAGQAAKVAEIEKSLNDMKKSLNLK